MKKIVKFFVFIIFVFNVLNIYCQNTNIIVKKNIFDPKRGSVEKQETENDEVVKEELPRNIPMLDGIIFLDKYKKAIFRYKDEKTRKLVSTNVFEGAKVGDAVVKKIEKEYVIVFFDGKSYKMNVDSKYDMEGKYKRNTGSSSGYIRSNVRRTNKNKSRTINKKAYVKKPVTKNKNSNNRRKSSGNTKMKEINTPFGVARIPVKK